ncbi:hypothetical protein D3C84_678120 [compost metagenome]
MAFADHPGVGHRACVGASQGAGQRETGDVIAARQSGQVVVSLCFGAVVQEQFGRAKGVGDHHGGRQVATAGGQLHRHLRVGEGRKPLAAILFGNDQGKKTVLLDVRPGLGRQVHGLADLPVADHRAQRFSRTIDEGLLFFAQLRLGVGQQFVPVRAAAEQLAIPPDCAGIDRVAFGL